MAAQSENSDALDTKSVPVLLDTIATCFSSAQALLPKITTEIPSDASIIPPPNGISLLDVKSDILLSYLHNLVFLVLFQLRKLALAKESKNDKVLDSTDVLLEKIVAKLAELRIYMEKGVRPLEGRLRYQVNKVIKAAKDADRIAYNAGAASRDSKEGKSRHTRAENKSGYASDNGSERNECSSEGSQDEFDEVIDEMAYRPNISAFSRTVKTPEKTDNQAKISVNGNIYRPPRIMPTEPPTVERREQKERRPRKSHVIDEFVSAEMSSMPMAEPSIGSSIVQRGRHTKSKKDKNYEAERIAYEETNFLRLPKETKSERAKRRSGRPEEEFGGEEWRELTEGADRIERLTRRTRGSENALEKSRKRKPTDDKLRSDGFGMGQTFEKRRKKVESWKR